METVLFQEIVNKEWTGKKLEFKITISIFSIKIKYKLYIMEISPTGEILFIETKKFEPNFATYSTLRIISSYKPNKKSLIKCMVTVVDQKKGHRLDLSQPSLIEL